MGRTMDVIKDNLVMRDVFDQYGFPVNHAGFIVCPFHSEKTASLGTYAQGKRWKCFGCGAGGDAITFVMKLFGLTFSQAVLRIGNDFGIIAASGLPGREVKALRREQQEQELQALKQYRAEYDAHFARFRDYEEALHWCKPIAFREPMLACFVQAISNIDNEWAWLQDHPWR